MELLEKVIKKNPIVIFCKSSDENSKRLCILFRDMKLNYKKVTLDKIGEQGIRLQGALIEKTGQKSLPNAFVKRWHVGGFQYASKCASNGTIQEMLDGEYAGFHYDMMVIGEGPGASMAALESARLGMKVAFCNYDIPTYENKKTGIKQRFMNQICDPKRLVQRASIIGTHIADALHFGWEIEEAASFNWANLITNIQRHFKESNTMCTKCPEDLLIKCFNAIPSFEGKHTVILTDEEHNNTLIKVRHFIIASSSKAQHFNIPGSNCCITPEDIFCLAYPPGRVIVIGCSEAGLCCAGILIANGIDVTLLATKNSMDDYDHEMVNRLIQDLSDLGAKVYPNGDLQEIEVVYIGRPGEYIVTFGLDDGEIICTRFNTIVFSNGRLPNIKKWCIDNVNVQCEKGTWKLITDEQHMTTVNNIFALGSVCKTKHTQTSTSRTALMVVQKIYGAENNVWNIIVAPSLLCSSLDYGFVGLSEEQAMEKYGREDIGTCHTKYKPVEYGFSSRYQKCYVKLVYVKSESELVVGLHMTGPYAGDVIQGYALGMRLGAKKSDFQSLIGIHPTTAEEFTYKLRNTQ